MRLLQLISDSMRKYFSHGLDDAVFSEEAIHLMLEAHKRMLTNLMFMREKSIPAFFEKIIADGEEKHYQLFVEIGTRSLLSQGEPAGIHYAAMDVFCDGKGKVVAFISDHYQGRNYSSYHASLYDAIPPESVQFIVVGGSTYQSDQKSCPIFTLSHLLITAKDKKLHAQLMQIASQSTEKVIQLPWYDLDPAYNRNTQSFNQLFSYAENIRQKGMRKEEAERSRLRTAEDCRSAEEGDFPPVHEDLEPPMFSKLQAFELDISRHLVFGEYKSQPKVFNHRILSLAMDYAKTAMLFAMVNGGTADTLALEEQLINICYFDEYPFIADILIQASKISSDLEKNTLFESIFSNQPLLNCLSEKTSDKKSQALRTDLYALLKNEAFITLVQKGYIDSDRFFAYISENDGKECQFIANHIKMFAKYISLGLFTQIEYAIREKPELNLTADIIFDLLVNKATLPLFKYESVMRLYFSGQITNALLGSVRIDHLRANKGSLSKMNEAEMKSALEGASRAVQYSAAAAENIPEKLPTPDSIFEGVGLFNQCEQTWEAAGEQSPADKFDY
jgi:hypothetical protein